jgi:hypothetical protein
MQFSFGSGESPTHGNALAISGKTGSMARNEFQTPTVTAGRSQTTAYPVVGTIDYRSPDSPSNFRHKSSRVQGVALFGGGPVSDIPTTRELDRSCDKTNLMGDRR